MLFTRFHDTKNFLIDLLEDHDSVAGRIWGFTLIAVIIATIISFILQTTPLQEHYGGFFRLLDFTALMLFSFEYILRLLVTRNRLKFIFSPLGIVDLLVIISFYSSLTNVLFLRGFRILQILEALKVIRYSDIFMSFMRAFKYYKDEIRIFLTVFSMVLIVSSTGLYWLEHDINPNFESMFDAFWWSLITISTVGYGDIVPVSIPGRIVASFVVLMGLVSLAMLTALVTKIFIDHFFGKHLHTCAHCSFPHHDRDARHCKNCGNALNINTTEVNWRNHDL